MLIKNEVTEDSNDPQHRNGRESTALSTNMIVPRIITTIIDEPIDQLTDELSFEEDLYDTGHLSPKT